MWTKEKELYERAIKHWGKDFQTLMLSEELGELLSAVSKYKRKRITKEELMVEIVDARLMISQICVLFGVNDKDLGPIKIKQLNKMRFKMENKVK